MSKIVHLNEATRRKTPCHNVSVFGVSMLFSYQTCMGFYSPEGKVRRRNHWGPTTGRHLRETGWGGVKELEDDEFDALLDDTILKAALVRLTGETQ